MRHMPRGGSVAGLLLCLCLVPSGWAATPGFTTRSAELRADPSFAARVVRRLTPGTEAVLQAQRGGWREVVVEGARGWVRTYQVRAGRLPPDTVVTSSEQSRGVLADLATLSRSASGLFSRSRTTSRTTATVGIRGLSAGELEAAQADPAQLEKLKSHVASRDEGRRLAAEARLRARSVKYLGGGS